MDDRLLTRRISLTLAAALVAFAAGASPAFAACNNPVSCENERPGSPPSTWQINGTGDASIQGYATSMSVNKGQTIRFKVSDVDEPWIYSAADSRFVAPLNR